MEQDRERGEFLETVPFERGVLLGVDRYGYIVRLIVQCGFGFIVQAIGRRPHGGLPADSEDPEWEQPVNQPTQGDPSALMIDR